MSIDPHSGPLPASGAKSYRVSLEQLTALADFISLVDAPSRFAECTAAHQIIQDILGPDEGLLYASMADCEEPELSPDETELE